jgi:hypothetical protein
VSLLATPCYELSKQPAEHFKLWRIVLNSNICDIYFGRILLHFRPSREGVLSGG